MNQKLILTGGPGGGKTTLLDALAKRGYPAVPESARQIIKARLAAGLPPRPSPAAFAREILHSDMGNYRSVATCKYSTFFDRGVLDALFMLDAQDALSRAKVASYVQAFPYNPVVFLLPPWEDIYATDVERDQTVEESVEVFEGMKRWYAQWGYETLEVPRGTVVERVKFVLQRVQRFNS